MTDDDLEGLTALVTGGASGIGLATVRTLMAAGARVAARDRGGVHHDGIVALHVDLADDGGVRGAATRAAPVLGGLDIVVNNAGSAPKAPWRTSPTKSDAVLDVNVLGIVHVTSAALPALRRSTHASSVNACSIAATADSRSPSTAE